MKLIILIPLLLILCENSIAQPSAIQDQTNTNKRIILYKSCNSTIVEDPVYGNKERFVYIEQMPEPPYSIPEYLSKNMVYPGDAKAAGIDGRVIIRFVVTETKTFDSVRVLKTVYPSLDKEAIRLVSKMPPWKPGKQNGKTVRVQYTLPVIFKLE